MIERIVDVLDVQSPAAEALTTRVPHPDKRLLLLPDRAGHARWNTARWAGNLAKATPIQKAGLPKDIAAAALFLASDEGHYVNCHDLIVDAGMTAGGRTNVAQDVSAPGGSYSDISPNILIPGTGDATTNYLHLGGATNLPPRFYRIRLAP